jgi:hypothetical protein
MPPVGSFMMGAFAVFIMWTLARALRNGIIFSDGVPYSANEQPMMFASMAAIHCSGAFLFAWLAASGGIPEFWRLIGPH